jgi:hypothetical protein
VRLPRGIGVYVYSAREAAIGTPRELAAQLLAARVRWVAFGGPWHDASGSKLLSRPDRIRAYADALAADGIESHVWGYPWWNRIEPFLAKMRECTTPAISGWLLDPEKGLRSRAREMRALVRGSRAALPGGTIGLTSFARTRLMGSVPWAEMATLDYGSPQLYTCSGRAVDRGLEEWAGKGFPEIIPSFGFHAALSPGAGGKPRYRSKTATELDEHLGEFIDPAVPVRGMIGWMHRWAKDASWEVVEKWSRRIERGALAVP